MVGVFILYTSKAVNAANHRCFSDIASRSNVLEMCSDRSIKGATVLDVGCGDGHISRELLRRGATKTVLVLGIDVCSAMIEVEAASEHLEKSRTEYYVVGDVAQLKLELLNTTSQTNLMPGAGFDMGVFDVTIASFLFNCMSITEMNQCVGDVYSLTKPGGYFTSLFRIQRSIAAEAEIAEITLLIRIDCWNKRSNTN